MENNIIKFTLPEHREDLFSVRKEAFDAKILSIVRNGDEVTITFDGPVTTISENAVRCGIFGGDAIIALELPDSVVSLTGRSFILPSPAKTKYCLMDDDGFIIKDGVLMAAYVAPEAVKITIPEGVVTIGPWAFPKKGSEKCEVILPKSLRRIEAHAFDHCHFKIKFNKGLEYIGDYAFVLPKGPTVTFPDTVKYVGDFAFWDTSEKVKKIKPGKGIEHIGRGAFGSTSAFDGTFEGPLAINDGLALAKDGVFMRATTGYQKLSKLGKYKTEIPEGIEIIDEGAIPQPQQLADLPESLKVIRRYGITGLCKEELNIPAAVEIIEEDALSNSSIKRFKGKFATTDGQYLIVNNVIVIAGSKVCTENEVIIPEGVERIGVHAMVTKFINILTLPASIKSIDKEAFGTGIINKREIKTINIKANVPFDWDMSAISDEAVILVPAGAVEAFRAAYPDRAQNIKAFGENVETVTVSTDEAEFFLQNKTLIRINVKSRWIKEITIPESVEQIADNLEWIATWERLGDNWKENIKKINLPASLKRIGAKAFANFPKVLSITFPKGLKEIGDQAFKGCNFGTITIPDKVKTIGIEAFAGNERLKKLKLGKGLEKIGKNAFALGYLADNKLESVEGKFATADKKMLIVDGVLCRVALTAGPDIVVPEGVTELAEKCMDNKDWGEINSLTLPEGLTEIKAHALKCYRIGTLVLPQSLQNIADEALTLLDIREFKGKFADGPFLIIGDRLIAVTVPATEADKVKEMIIPDYVTVIGPGVFSRSPEKMPCDHVVLPPKLRRIEESAFAYNRVTISALPETLEYIGNSAFNSILPDMFPDGKIVLPPNVKELGSGAVSGGSIGKGWDRKYITIEVWIESPVPPKFDKCPFECVSKLHVPEGTVEAYSEALAKFKEDKFTPLRCEIV
ncbi:MAG: leucine-rich repeat domain-containing protein [Muribaculaceae bacterium]|nr:leucine-rich repeat domain-containing protein [Muribaculaceae bacterium]